MSCQVLRSYGAMIETVNQAQVLLKVGGETELIVLDVRNVEEGRRILSFSGARLLTRGG